MPASKQQIAFRILRNSIIENNSRTKQTMSKSTIKKMLQPMEKEDIMEMVPGLYSARKEAVESSFGKTIKHIVANGLWNKPGARHRQCVKWSERTIAATIYE